MAIVSLSLDVLESVARRAPQTIEELRALPLEEMMKRIQEGIPLLTTHLIVSEAAAEELLDNVPGATLVESAR